MCTAHRQCLNSHIPQKINNFREINESLKELSAENEDVYWLVAGCMAPTELSVIDEKFVELFYNQQMKHLFYNVRHPQNH